MKRPRDKRHSVIVTLVTLAVVAVIAFIAASYLRPWIPQSWKGLQRLAFIQPPLWQRPDGMAPAAFQAFMRACRDTKISPARIGQTMGDHPASVGYHKRDGVLVVNGQRIEYSAAVDLGANDLDRATLNRFLANLTKQGFACWYREKGHWKGREHIHAVYAQLPMKYQLRGQVRQFLRERRAKGIKPLAWERRLKTNRFASLYPKRTR